MMKTKLKRMSNHLRLLRHLEANWIGVGSCESNVYTGGLNVWIAHTGGQPLTFRNKQELQTHILRTKANIRKALNHD